MDDLFYNINENIIFDLLNMIRSFNYRFTINEVVPKDIFFKKSICLILDGYINISKIDYNGNYINIDTINKNELFISMSTLILDDDYEITSGDNTRIIIIDINSIIHNQLNNDEFNQLNKNIIDILCNNIYELSDRLEIMSNKTIRNKLLAYFKMLSKKYNSNVIYLPSTFISLSNYLCIDRSAMNREIKHLKDEKLIDVKGKRIKLNYYVN